MIFLISTSYGIEKSAYQNCMRLIENKEFAKIEPILDSLEKNHSNDPETYVLIVNYYVKKGIQEVVILEKGVPDSGIDALMLKDENTGKEVGYMGSRMQIDTSFIINGINKLYTGTLKHPDRMDMWFGQASVSRTIGYVKGIERALIGVLRRSTENKNNWQWGFENIEEDNKTQSFMIENLQSYTNFLFNMQKDVADSALVRISELLIEFYPNLIYGYNNIGIIRSLQGQYEKAQEYMEKASEIDPDDLLVLSNMGNNLSKMNKKKELKKLIKRVEKIKGEQAKSLVKHLKTLL